MCKLKGSAPQGEPAEFFWCISGVELVRGKKLWLSKLFGITLTRHTGPIPFKKQNKTKKKLFMRIAFLAPVKQSSLSWCSRTIFHLLPHPHMASLVNRLASQANGQPSV